VARGFIRVATGLVDPQRMKRGIGWGYAVGIEVGFLPGARELVFELDPGTSSTPDCAKGRVLATGARLLEFFDEVP
jgi:hypothetical protein